jgi:hypothetical protein
MSWSKMATTTLIFVTGAIINFEVGSTQMLKSGDFTTLRFLFAFFGDFERN